MTTATKPRVRRKVCTPAVAPVPEKSPEAQARDDRLVRLLKTRCGRVGHSPVAPTLSSLQRNFGFKEKDLEKLGLVGCRRVTCFAYDSFASHCGRFMLIARDEHVEQNMPMRLCFGFDLSRTEMWADGKLVAKTTNMSQAVNWLMLKMHGRAFLTESLLAKTPC